MVTCCRKEDKATRISWRGGQQGEDLSEHPACAPQGSGLPVWTSLSFAFRLASFPAWMLEVLSWGCSSAEEPCREIELMSIHHTEVRSPKVALIQSSAAVIKTQWMEASWPSLLLDMRRSGL